MVYPIFDVGDWGSERRTINTGVKMEEGFPGGSAVKNPPTSVEDARDVGSIPGLGGSPGGGNGNPPQYSCLEKPMDRGAWQTAVHGITKSQRQLK